jgi:hypothetical protein
MKAIATLPVLCCGPDTPPIGEAESESWGGGGGGGGGPPPATRA